MLRVCQSIRTSSLPDKENEGDLRCPVADRDQKHPTVVAATQANT